jgi:Leucine-rich repeat (LRR) protein
VWIKFFCIKVFGLTEGNMSGVNPSISTLFAIPTADCMPESKWQEITELDLSFSETTTQMLLSSPALSALTLIDLSYCRKINDEVIPDLIKHVRLNTLIVTGANISREAIQRLKGQKEEMSIQGEPSPRDSYSLSDIDQAEILPEAAEHHPLLRQEMEESRGISRWSSLSELPISATEIQQFYIRQYEARGLDLSLFNNGSLIEVVLQEYDGFGLSSLLQREAQSYPFEMDPRKRFTLISESNLSLSSTTLSASSFLSLPLSSSMSSIDLSKCEWVNDAVVLSLCRYPQLKEIHMDEAQVSPDTLEILREERPGIRIVSPSKKGSRSIAPHYPFLRRVIYEYVKVKDQVTGKRKGVTDWHSLAELADYNDSIEQFYKQELNARGLFCSASQSWAEREQLLKEHDRLNLNCIMQKLVPVLKKAGYFQKSTSLQDQGSKIKDPELDCFEVLWQMILVPRMLNTITELDLSNLGLTEIPLSFSRLYFSQLRSLSFAGNPIYKIPFSISEEFLSRKVEGFFSKYPSLESISFSNCRLSSIEGIFSFLPTSEEADRISVLPNLRRADFSFNQIESLPKRFGIDPDREAKDLLIILRNNQISEVSADTLDDLTSASPVLIKLDLAGNQFQNYPNWKSQASNVKLFFINRPG